MRIIRLFTVLLLGLVSGACSTIVSGTDQSIMVVSEPPGATCELKREGASVGYVNPTPGSALVTKSKDPIAVMCEKEGHLPGTGVLAAAFEGMTVGNVLFGGIIGVAIDASSGAMNQYPDSITILLAPESFVSEAERDLFFDNRIASVESQHAQALETANNSALCKKDYDHPDCVELLAEIDQARDDELQRLEQQRAMAKIE